LTELNRELTKSSRTVSADLERAKNDLHTTTNDLHQARRDHEREMHELERRQEREANTITSKHEKQLQKLERDGERAVEGLEKEVKAAREEMEKKKRDELADLTTQHWEELDEVNTRHASEITKLKAEIAELRKSDEGRAAESADQVQALKDNITSLQTQLEAGNATMNSLRKQLASVEQQSSALEQEKAALVSKAHFLEGNQEAQSLEFTTMSEKLAEALAAKEATIETLRREEMLRRKLNATILELKGNIRVFVRTRPLLGDETDPAKVEYPDLDSLEGTKEMIVHAPTTKTATGKERNEKHAYGFDRVFTAGTPNRSVFEECQELVQSVIDGYNVSILSYGQTGSGKTFGMSGVDGIIPSSISHLLSEIRRLKSKGWDYVVEASFVEVYNEMINDLLGDAKTWDTDDDASARKKKEKHEIHHDPITGKTTVNNLTARALWPPPKDDASWPPAASDVPVDKPTDEQAMAYTTKAVDQLLDAAAKNRRVAATKANERSSRSHSIFMLTLKGSCPATGESSEGILNLVDLAGSERLKQSGAEGNRMKETQAINKSLSSLGDVIAALGSGKGEAHVPYRNSKVCLFCLVLTFLKTMMLIICQQLTYLLQSSLGGTAANGKSSRTLMMLHLSPLAAHWQESRSSLLFGSKVHGTHIGAAKKR
jgi:kinesin family protein C1